jgi:hypothetical protein
MTRRYALLLLPVGIGVGVVLAWLLWPCTAITQQNAARIREGMTRDEVEAILGGPPRDESPYAVHFAVRSEDERLQATRSYARWLVDHLGPEPARKWLSHQALVVVQFDAFGRVACSLCVLAVRARCACSLCVLAVRAREPR